MAKVTEAEGAALICTILKPAFPDLSFDLFVDYSGDVSIYVIADPSMRPNINSVLPSAWVCSEWNSSDYRGNICAITGV